MRIHRAALLVVFVVLASAAHAADIKPTPVKADAPQYVKDYFKRADEDRANWAASLPKRMAREREALGRARKSGNRAAAERITNVIQDLTAKSKALPTLYYWEMLIGQGLDVGDMGTVDLCKVIQVTGPQSAIVELFHQGLTYDPQAREYEATIQRRTVVILKQSTKGWVDGRPEGLHGVYRVSGTETYASAGGGSNTAFVLEPIDLGKWIDE